MLRAHATALPVINNKGAFKSKPGNCSHTGDPASRTLSEFIAIMLKLDVCCEPDRPAQLPTVIGFSYIGFVDTEVSAGEVGITYSDVVAMPSPRGTLDVNATRENPMVVDSCFLALPAKPNPASNDVTEGLIERV